MPFWRRSSGKKSQEDARSHRKRPSKAAPVEVQIMGGNSLDILHARDISGTGLAVFVPHGFAGCDLDQEVQLVITLPRRRTFIARGVVRHITRKGKPEQYFGIEFTTIQPKHRDQIIEYVSVPDDQ